MAMGAVLAAALTDHSARAFGLFMDGLDLVRQPGATQPYGVSIDSVRVTEAGPGRVSSMSFTVDDPLSLLSFYRGSYIRFADLTNDVPLFAGFLGTWSPRPYEPTGRYVDVTCVGIEIILDWAKMAPITIPAGTNGLDTVQMILANTLTGFADPPHYGCDTGGNANGYQANPIGLVVLGFPQATALAIPGGMTVREALRTAMDNAVVWPQLTLAQYILFDVDFYTGIRAYLDYVGEILHPTDYKTLPIGTSLPTSNHKQTWDAASAPVAVLVEGSGGAQTLVTDGTNDPGETAYLLDTNLTTATQRQGAGYAYMARSGAQLRGGFDLTEVNPSATMPGTADKFYEVRAGSILTTTGEPGMSPDLVTRVATIDRTFVGAVQDWHVTYGLGPASLATLVRRLTRGVLA